MAKVKTNPIIEQVRGKIGNLVFRRYGDTTIVSSAPVQDKKNVSEAQAATRQRFREAALYGKMVMADAEKKVIYEEAAKATGKPVFCLTIADFFNAPAVDEVDMSGYTGKAGDLIRIRAHDDFDVVGVSVAIANSEGQSLESGEAVETPAKSGIWIYTATQAVATGTTVRIAVTATDRPGGKGKAQQEKAV